MVAAVAGLGRRRLERESQSAADRHAEPVCTTEEGCTLLHMQSPHSESTAAPSAAAAASAARLTIIARWPAAWKGLPAAAQGLPGTPRAPRSRGSRGRWRGCPRYPAAATVVVVVCVWVSGGGGLESAAPAAAPPRPMNSCCMHPATQPTAQQPTGPANSMMHQQAAALPAAHMRRDAVPKPGKVALEALPLVRLVHLPRLARTQLRSRGSRVGKSLQGCRWAAERSAWVRGCRTSLPRPPCATATPQPPEACAGRRAGSR